MYQICRSSPAAAVAFWSRVYLPQVLGAELVPLASQKAPSSKPVHKLGPSGTTLVLGYLREILEGSARVDSKPFMARIGPEEGDPKGYWALKAAATPLLDQAKVGIDTQVGHQRLSLPFSTTRVCAFF